MKIDTIDNISDFDFEVTIETQFTQNNVPFLAQEIARVHEGSFKDTTVLIGPKGLMARLVKDGSYVGYIGFSYNEWLGKAVEYADTRIGVKRNVPEAIGL